MQRLAVILAIAAIRTEAIVRPLGVRSARETNSYGAPPSSSTPAPSGPYPPSGWAPNGNLLLLPGETHSSQQDGYGQAPPPPPPNKYGAPQPTTQPTTTTTATESNLDADATNLPADGTNENGQYYVLLGNGKLQKVQYSGKQRGRGQYEAQVQYEEVEPIRPPIYSFNPALPEQQLPFP